MAGPIDDLFQCAVRRRGGRFEQAQRRKYQRLLDLLEARPGQRIPEIGCGWGGCALEAAKRGLHVTGITLSREQLEYASERMQAAGFADLVELRLQDYARTLAEWRRRFLKSEKEVAQMGFDARFRRMWCYYFAYCEAGFRNGRIDLAQVLIEHR